MGCKVETADVVVVGAGIMGLAQAWSAARQGNRVVVLEQTRRSQGASIRNFGMIWPIGQPAGDRLDLALASRERWLELADLTGIYVRSCGSLFTATDGVEADVMRDFADQASGLGYQAEFLSAKETHHRSAIVREDAIRGGLFSHTELNIDPVQATQALADYLVTELDVTIRWEHAVQRIEDGCVITNRGSRISAPTILVCQGDVAAHLYPQAITDAQAVSCKLHMLASESQQQDMGPMLATGLTLIHYHSFRACAQLAEYAEIVHRQHPDLERFGIHVMISQDARGRWILGDSHQYGDEATPFHDEAIDALILAELEKRFRLPSPLISSRWQGYYLKRPGYAVLVSDPEPGVRIVNGLGGNGMTLSFGIADAMWNHWEHPSLLAGLPDPVRTANPTT